MIIKPCRISTSSLTAIHRAKINCTQFNSLECNAMQCNSIPFNAEFHSPQTPVTPTDLRCNCIGREHLWLIMLEFA